MHIATTTPAPTPAQTREAAIAANLAAVDAHIQGEAQDPASVLALYTDDVVLEVPSRGLRFTNHADILANYRRMFASMAEVEIVPLDRFATEDRVVDDCLVRLRITGDGLTNAPFGPGTRVELRLLHVFHMHGGRIAREQVFEGWRRLD
jgi:ketosteroid isomerase-like protein